MSLDGNRYRLLVDAITDYAIYMLDPNGIIASWNPGARRFKGYEEADVVGTHFSRFYTEEDRKAGLPATALRVADREGRFEAEGWRVRKDGTRFWAYVVIDPIRSPSGDLIGFAKVTRDLSERREAELALRRSEEQFRLLVQSVTDYAIFMLDLQGNVSSWNAGAERIKGYSAADILGRHFSAFYTDEDRAAGLPRRALEIATREGRFEQEGLRVRKDGSRFMAHVIIDPVRSESGALVGFAKVTRDISERVENQRKLEEAREILFQSQKMEAVGQLSAGIAHDFNNLLAAILGGLEILKKRPPADPRAAAILDNLVHAAERGTGLIRRMLAFARRQDLLVQPVAVPDLVRSMSDLLARTIGPQISIEEDFPPDLPMALTDTNHLETAILNLLVNARDAMPDGGTVRIRAAAERLASTPEGPAGDYVRITVADTGEGMDAATLARAIEPFFTTKEVGKGTGLGLSMVHGLVTQSGGRMKVASTPGVGTEVTLWLPVADVAVAPAPAGPEARTTAGSGAPLQVLAVDDDKLVLSSTATMLEELGHRVTGVTSASEALEALRAGPAFDLVVTDHVMPRMTGRELMDEVRRLRPGLAVLLLTGHADLDADDVDVPMLQKPFTVAQLASAVAGVAPRA